MNASQKQSSVTLRGTMQVHAWYSEVIVELYRITAKNYNGLAMATELLSIVNVKQKQNGKYLCSLMYVAFLAGKALTGVS